MMKKKNILAVAVAFVMSVCAVALVGCSKKDTKKPTTPSYTVTYIANGGIFANGLTTRTESVKKDGHALGNVTPTHPDSLQFLGWGDGATATTTVDLSTRPVTADVTYYAVWNSGEQPPETCTVTFYYNYDGAPNGGVFDTKSVNAGQAVSRPANDPSRGTEYTFGGWYTAQNGGTEYNFSATVSGTLSLYAHWTPAQQQVTLQSIEASAPTAKLTIVSGQSFDESSLVVVANYSDGSHDTLSSADYDVEYPTDMTTPGEKTVTVRFDGQTDTVTVTVIPRAIASIVIGGNLTEREQDVGARFNPAGLTFRAVYNDGTEEPINVSDVQFTSTKLDDGKFTEAADPAIVYASYGGVTSASGISVKVVVPAVVRHDVVFNANNSVYASNIQGMPNAQRVEDGLFATIPVAPSLKGFRFDGWYTTAACATAWDFDNGAVVDDLNLYAKWTAKTYTVEYNYNGGNGGVDPNPATYTATSGEFADVTLTEPSKGHNSFGGWYTTSLFQTGTDVTELSYDILPDNSDTIRLFAKFTPETYSLTFSFGDNNGVTYNAVLKTGVTFPQNYTYGSTVSFPTADDIQITALISGDAVEFNFLGWYLSTDVAKTHVNGISDTDFNNKTFVVDIVQAATHTVTFDYNYAGSTPTVMRVLDGGTVSAISPAPTRTGYTFEGWFKEHACTTAFDFTEPVTEQTGDKIAYAKWEPVQYTVEYKNVPAGCVNTNNPVMYVITDGEVDLNPPTTLPTGYRFSGWFFNSGLSVAVSKLTPADIATRVQENKFTIYGSFSNQYTVTFSENIASGSVTGMPSDMSVVYGNGIVRPATDPTRVNYTFGGWYADAACSAVWQFSGAATPTAVTSDVTVYTKWIENPDDGVYIYGTLNDFSMIPTGSKADFEAAYKATVSGTTYTVGGITLASGDEFKFVNYTKANGNIESIAPVQVNAYPASGITVAVSGDVYKVNAYGFTEAVTFEIEQSASALSVVPDSLGRDYIATLSPSGTAAQYTQSTAATGVAYIVGNFTEYKYYAEWSSNSSIVTTAKVGNKYVFTNITLRKYDEFRVAGLGMTASRNMWVENNGVYNIVYDTDGTVRLIQSKTLAAAFTGTVYEGKMPAATDFTVTYDGAPLASTDYTVISGAAALGGNTATIVYLDGGAVITVSYTGTADAVSTVVCDTQPDKLTYYVGDAFVADGAEFTVTYLSGDNVTVLAGNAALTFAVASDYTENAFTAKGAKSVTFTYGGVTSAAITVNVYDKLDKIEVTTLPKQSYIAESGVTELDLTGMVVKAFYNGGSTGVAVNVTADNVSHSIDFDSVDDYTVTVTFTDAGNNNQVKTATFTVSVVAPQIVSVAVTGAPQKTAYFVGDTFVPAGLVFTATLDNGKTQAIAATDAKLAFNGGNAFASAGSSVTVPVTYTVSADNVITVTGAVTVTVNDKLTGISATAPTASHTHGTDWVVNDTLTQNGMTVTAFYNGSDEGKTVTGFTTDVAEVDMTSTGEKTVTVTYAENGITKTTTVKITVVAKAVVALNVSGTPADQYLNANFNPTGLTFTAVYNNDETSAVDVNDITFTSDEFSTGTAFGGYGDNVTVTATYSEKSCDITVKVINDSRFTVRYNANITGYAPVGMPAQNQVVFNGTIAKPTDPTLKGFAFDGWYKEASCTTPWKFDGEEGADKIKVATDIYAKWTAKSYTVNYKGETGNGTLAASGTYSATAGVFGEFTLPTDIAPAKENYNFVGWYKDGDSAGNHFTKLTYDLLPESGEDIDLRPAYEKVKYTVTFVYGNGDENGSEQVEHGGTVTEPNEPTREYYDFGGWFKSGETTAFDFTSAITAPVTLTAKWDAIQYTVTYTCDDGSVEGFTKGDNPDNYKVTDGSVTLKPATTTTVGKAFSHWENAQGNTVTGLTTALIANGGISLTAVFVDADTFTITFNSDGGSAVAPITGIIDGQTAEEPTAPTKAGHTFMGWFKDGSASKFDFLNTAITEDVTLTAHWDKNSYAVTFETGEGGSDVAGQTVKYGELVTKPAPDPTRPGYVFRGWFKEEACTNAWDFAADTVPDHAVTIYAKWEVKPLSVTFNYNYTGAPAATEGEVNDGIVTRPDGPTRDYYKFDGWYTSATPAAGAKAFDFDTAITEDTTLYAKWVAVNGFFKGTTLFKEFVEHGTSEYAAKCMLVTTANTELVIYRDGKAQTTTKKSDSPAAANFAVSGTKVTFTDTGVYTVYYNYGSADPGLYVVRNGNVADYVEPDIREETDGIYVNGTRVAPFVFNDNNMNQVMAQGVVVETESLTATVAVTLQYKGAAATIAYLDVHESVTAVKSGNTVTMYSGTYDFYYNYAKNGTVTANNHEYAANRLWVAGTQTGIATTPLTKDAYLAGTINGWTTDSADYKFDNTNGTLVRCMLKDDQFKVVYGGAWLGYSCVNSNMTEYVEMVPHNEGATQANIKIKENGQYLFAFDGTKLTVVKVGEFVESTITFDAQSGTFTGESAPVTRSTTGGKIAAEDLPAVTREGFVFGGWYTEKDGKGALVSAATFYSTATVYAKWTAEGEVLPENSMKVKFSDGVTVVIVFDAESIPDDNKPAKNIHLHMWAGSTNLLGSFPGTAMTGDTVEVSAKSTDVSGIIISFTNSGDETQQSNNYTSLNFKDGHTYTCTFKQWNGWQKFDLEVIES